MLQLRGIGKSYGGRRVLDDVSFDVGPGRLTGFVGGNGAGKTTTMRIVLGVLAGDAGTVTLDGAEVTASDRRRFGYMPEERGLYPKMKVHEHITYLARLHGFSKTDAAARARALLEQLGLGERLNDNVETLSLGNQQRAQIAAALVHDPQVLILDEPTDGLDPNQKHEVRELISAMSKDKIIVISTHILEEVDAVCNRAIIIAAGRILADETPKALARRAPSGRLDDVFRQITLGAKPVAAQEAVNA